jgi:NADH-quinone oxidoreductase subunit G
MNQNITITIDGKEYSASSESTILNIARANGVFIPAICYLTNCSANLACRLCMVDVDGKRAYSCNVKAKDGMNVITSTDEIEADRKAIMQVYDINHPLACGVCDQSGECELQDYSLRVGVSSQEYAIADTYKPTQEWSVMKYDPSLCIVCQRCVSVCDDIVGANALSTVKRGGNDIDKSYKESMSKDSYAVWNKMNKSLIGFDESKCTECGECIDACPVGALTDKKFQYTSNAWELSSIPASNPFSSDCSLLYYDVKQSSISDNKTKIYRVKNEKHYSALSGAARFGFDYALNTTKDETKLLKAIDAFKKADSVVFNSYITNEEALILQKLKEKLGFKLVNKDAKRYQEFLEEFSKGSGKSLYSGTFDDVKSSELVISVGSYLKSDAPSLKYAFNNAIKNNKAHGLYFHSVEDESVKSFGKVGKNLNIISHKPLKIEAILLSLLSSFSTDLPDTIKEYLDGFEVAKEKEITKTVEEEISEVIKNEDGTEEEVTKKIKKDVTETIEIRYNSLVEAFGMDDEFDQLLTTLKTKEKKSLIIGEDCIKVINSKRLAYICGVIEKYSDIDVIVIPPQTNTLGVSLICELDSEVSGYSVGYNEKADFELSSLGDGDIDMPPLISQEGTFCSFDKEVVPTNVAVKFDGYSLNDIANKLGLYSNYTIDYTIDYTSQLPLKNGFKSIEFDSLKNYFGNDGVSYRGYKLEAFSVDSVLNNLSKESIEFKLDSNEYLIYQANPTNQFNEFSAKSSFLGSAHAFTSSEVLASIGVESGSEVLLRVNKIEVKIEIYEDKSIKNSVICLPFFEKESLTDHFFALNRYNKAVVSKV